MVSGVVESVATRSEGEIVLLEKLVFEYSTEGTERFHRDITMRVVIADMMIFSNMKGKYFFQLGMMNLFLNDSIN